MHRRVSGFLEKQTSAEILTKAIREVAAGGIFFSPSIAKRLRDEQNKPLSRDGTPKANGTRLTAREAEVLQLVAEGSANKQVAVPSASASRPSRNTASISWTRSSSNSPRPVRRFIGNLTDLTGLSGELDLLIPGKVAR